MLQLQGIVNHDQESISTILALSFSLIISPNKVATKKTSQKNATKGDAFNAEEKKYLARWWSQPNWKNMFVDLDHIPSPPNRISKTRGKKIH